MVALGAVLGSAALPASSLASTLAIGTDNSSSIPKMSYVAANGEVNNVTVDLANGTVANGVSTGGTYTVTDPGASITTNAPCINVSPTSATCPATGTNRVTVNAGDMDDTVRMNAKPPKGTTILGGTGSDSLNGGPGSDTMDGGDGGDTMVGGPGNDVMDPGIGGNSQITSNDPLACDLIGEVPPCTITVIDKMDGGAGFNTMRFVGRHAGIMVDERTQNGESMIDDTGVNKGPLINFAKVVGTPFDDILIGGPRADILAGEGGADVMCGGYGTDTVDYSNSPGPVNVSLTPNPAFPDDPRWGGSDIAKFGLAPHDCRQTRSTTSVDGQEGDPIPIPRDAQGHWTANPPLNCIANDGTPGEGDCVGADVENVIGSKFNDVLTGNDPGPHIGKAGFYEPRGRNVLDGGGGDDVLNGGLGADVLIGGDGIDTVDYSSQTLPVQVSLDGRANDGSSADLNPDSGQADSVGSDVENIIGGSGNDVLTGSSEPNNIQGGPGDDTLQGGGGNDTLDGGQGNDVVEGGDGNDQVQGGEGNDYLIGNLGADVIDGGDGTDVADYSGATTPVSVTPDGVANDGTANEGDNVLGNVESLIGGSANDVLVGNAGDGVIEGGGGNDTLDGGGGSDIIVGGEGLDTLTYASRTNPVTVDLQAGSGGEAGEADTIAPDVEAVTGGSGNDTISGNDAVNILTGGPGNDTIDGRGGDDQLFGGTGNDTLSGGAGSDTINGGQGDDNLQGGTEADSLFGDEGNDQLDGGPGADKLTGGAGDDTALYSARTKDVSVTMDGADNDGEKGELDQVRLSVESTKTGAGNDSINVRDGVKGEVSCGKGNDSVIADAVDTVASDCEQVDKVSAASTRCSVRNSAVTMSSSGLVKLRLTCPSVAKGTLTLQTAGAYKSAKKKKVTLGRKSFSLTAGKSKTLSIKLSKKAKRLVKRNKRLRVRAVLSIKGASSAKASKVTKTLTIRAPKRKR
jgi:Ca2+-binding RTX toxin-like protein